jgi:hypothetical protein
LFANYGRHPKYDIFTLAKVDNLITENLATHLYNIQKEMKSRLQKVQEKYKINANKFRKEQPLFQLEIRIVFFTTT